jgi:HK97 family phage major capsid protein
MNIDRGLLATRIVRSIAAGGTFQNAAAFAAGRGARWTDAAEYLKAAVSAVGADANTDWETRLAADLRALYRGQSVVGRLRGVRRAPFNVRLLSTTAGATASWAGAGAGFVVARQSSSEIAAPLDRLKFGAISVFTQELAMLSDPSVDAIVSADLSSALRKAEDLAFIDLTNAGVADVTPASVTFGASERASTGSSLAQIDADLRALLQAASDADANLSMSTFVMSEKTATFLASLRGTGGDLAYPNVRVHTDGEIFGVHQIASQSAVSAGSPTNNAIALIDGSQIWIAEGGAEITTSKVATLEMSDAPSQSSSTPTGANQVSLFQTDSVAIKAVLAANWKRVSADSVQILSGVSY